jgi:hypothetical protein
MDEVEMASRVKNLVAVLARMDDKVGGRDLDALQECLRLAEGVPGLCEGRVQVRLGEAAPRAALEKYGGHADGCRGGASCGCGLRRVLDAGTGPDLLAYLVLLQELAAAVRRCELPIPRRLWDATGKLARWKAAHRGVLELLGEIARADGRVAWG